MNGTLKCLGTAILVAWVTTGCGAPTPDDDSGQEVGDVDDAGPAPEDAGPPSVDAGATPDDAGSPVTDAGPPSDDDDAGAPVADGGPSDDAGDNGVEEDAGPDNPSPPSDVDLNVRIDAAVGPHGEAAPVEVDRRIYGVSIANWRPEDYRPSPDPVFLAYLRALQPGVLRWPAGHSSQEYAWEGGPPPQVGQWLLTEGHVDDFMGLADDVGADVLLAINVKTSTPQTAADLIRYVNVERGYGVRYVQLGNEPDHLDGFTPSPEVHAARHTAFVDALLAVDPDLFIVGPELMTGAHALGIHGTVDWLGPVLAAEGHRLDAVSWHYYPMDSGQTVQQSSAIPTLEHLFQESAPDWRPASMSFVDEIMPALGGRLLDNAPGAEIWITELGEDPGPAEGGGLSDTMAGALWGADILGRYASYGPGAIIRWLFKGASSQLLSLLDHQNQPRPTYSAWWLLARHFGDRIVHAESDDETVVAVHAARDGDALSVVLVNKTGTARAVGIDLDGFPASSAVRFTLQSDGLQGRDVAINGVVMTPEVAQNGVAPVPLAEDDLFFVEVPAASVTVVVYQ